MERKLIKFIKNRSLYLILAFVVIFSSIIITCVFTGAWFTGSDSSELATDSLTFGSVRLGDNLRVMQVDNLVPTGEIHYHGGSTDNDLQDIDYAGTVDAYYRIRFDVKKNQLVSGHYTAEDAYSETFQKLLDFNTTSQELTSNQQLRDDWNIYGKITPDHDIPRGTIRLSSETPNLFADRSFVIILTIDLFQAANLNEIEGVGTGASQMTTLLNYQNLFYYYDYGTVADTTGLQFTSNEDGTCCVSGYTGNYDIETLKIPMYSPEGDVVTEIKGVDDNTWNYYLNGGRRAHGYSYFCNEEITSSYGGSTKRNNNITKVIISPCVTSIGVHAFSFMPNVTEAILSPNLTSIGSCAFASMRKLLNISLADSIVSIGANCFYACNALKAISIPKELLIFETGLLSSCPNIIMPVFKIDAKLTTVSNAIFQDDAGLKVLVLPATVTNINTGSGSFITNCNALVELRIKENNVYYSKGNCIIQKSNNRLLVGCCASEIPYGVTSLGSNAFSYVNSGTTEFIIPQTVTGVSNSCVSGITLYTTITIKNKDLILPTNGAFGAKNVVTINYNGTTEYFLSRSITRSKLFGTSNNNTITIHCTDGDLIMASGSQTATAA